MLLVSVSVSVSLSVSLSLGSGGGGGGHPPASVSAGDSGLWYPSGPGLHSVGRCLQPYLGPAPRAGGHWQPGCVQGLSRGCVRPCVRETLGSMEKICTIQLLVGVLQQLVTSCSLSYSIAWIEISCVPSAVFGALATLILTPSYFREMGCFIAPTEHSTDQEHNESQSGQPGGSLTSTSARGSMH